MNWAMPFPEVLRARSCDIHLAGGEHCDHPHVWFGHRSSDPDLPGQGKLGSENVAARLDAGAVETMRRLRERGVECEKLPELNAFCESHRQVFNQYRAFSTKMYRIADGDELLFPSLRRGKQPWMSRQSVWNAVHRVRTVMFQLTGHRRYNPDRKFNGTRVSVRGATRHTGAALLLFNPAVSAAPPSEATIMEIQQQHDAGGFKRHYCHAHEVQVQNALEYAAISTSLGRDCAGPASTPTDASTTADASSSHGGSAHQNSAPLLPLCQATPEEGPAVRVRQSAAITTTAAGSSPGRRAHQNTVPLLPICQAAPKPGPAERVGWSAASTTADASSSQGRSSHQNTAPPLPKSQAAPFLRPAERLKASADPRPAATDPLLAPAHVSRNAWRKKQRREGKLTWCKAHDDRGE